MATISTIQKESTWGTEATKINQNFTNVNTELTKLNNTYGLKIPLFSSTSAASASIPSPYEGQLILVGSTLPAPVYRWNGSSWANTGTTGGSASAPLTDYYTKEEVDASQTEQDEKLTELSSLGLGVQTNNGISLLKNIIINGYWNSNDGVFVPGTSSFLCIPKISKKVGNHFKFISGNNTPYIVYNLYIWKSDSFRKISKASEVILEEDDIDFAFNILKTSYDKNAYIKCMDAEQEINAIKEDINAIKEKIFPTISCDNVFTTGKNLFNIEEVIIGKIVDKPSGSIISSNTYPNAICSPVIPISKGITYTLSNRADTTAAVGYNKNGDKVKIFPDSSDYTLPIINGQFLIPEDSEAVSMQFTCRLYDVDISQLQLEIGNSATEYEAYKEISLLQTISEIKENISNNEKNINELNSSISYNWDDFDGKTWYSGTEVGGNLITYTNGGVVALYGIKANTKKNDVWEIQTLGGRGTGRGWIVTDMYNKILAVADASVNTLKEPYKLEVTYDDAAFLYVNCQKGTTDNKDKFFLYKRTLGGRVENVEKEIEAIKEFVNPSSVSPLFRKKYKAFGSSSTENWTPYYGEKGSYAQRVADRNEMIFTNEGKSGYTLAHAEGSNYGFIVDIVLAEESTDLDYVTLMVGANDATRANITFKGVDTPKTELTDFYGAFKATIEHLIELNPLTKIGIIIPFAITGKFAEVYKGCNEIAEYYGIPILDINKFGFDGIFANHATQYSEELKAYRKSILGVENGSAHITGEAMEKLSYVVENWMKGI